MISRTICLLYGIELVFDVMIGRATSYCGGYTDVPLPSVRSLWEPVIEDSISWRARYQQAASLSENITTSSSGSSTAQHTVVDLTIGDLTTLAPKQQGMFDIGAEGHDAATSLRLTKLEKWCDELDDFGMLI